MNTQTAKRKTIELINVYSSRNIGDAAIYASLKMLAKNNLVYWPNNRRIASCNAQNAQQNNRQIGAIIHSFNKLSKEPDVRVSVGGDIFNCARPRFITRNFLSNLSDLACQKKNSFVFGQSIPRSCRGLSFQFLKHVFSRLSSVTVRDAESFKRLNEAGVPVTLSYDTVFCQTPQHSWFDAVNRYLPNDIDLAKTALISLRPFDAMYQYSTQECIQKIVRLCQLLIQKGITPAVLIHAKVDENDTDTQMVKAIQRHCEVKVIDPYIAEDHIAAWQFALALTVMSYLCIGIRYHSSIFRLVGGKMPFNIYYSNKGEDLCKRLNIPGVSIQSFEPERHLQQILDTANQSFDPAPIAERVQQDFDTAFYAVSHQSIQSVVSPKAAI